MRGPANDFQIDNIENVEVKDTTYRSIIFDVRCKLKSGDRVIVELQKAEMRRDIIDRLYGYQANDYTQQWGPGGATELQGRGSYKLVPVRMLALLDFNVHKDRAKCGTLVQHYHIQHDSGDPLQVPSPVVAERLKSLSDITIVQLPLAPKTLEKGMTDAEKWAHLLRWSQDYTYETLPAPLNAAPFLAAANSARFDNMTPEERNALHLQVDDWHEWRDREAAAEAAQEARAAAEAKAAAAEGKAADEATARAAAEAKAADEATARAAAEAKAADEATARAAAEAKAADEATARAAAEAKAAAAEGKAADEATARAAAEAKAAELQARLDKLQPAAERK